MKLKNLFLAGVLGILIGSLLSLPPLSFAQTVNGIATTNTATGVNPIISSTGTDVNIGMRIQDVGQGTFQFNGASGTHIEYRQAASPSLTTSLGSLVARCTDTACQITAGATSPITFTFAQAFTNTPVCVASNSSRASGVRINAGTASVTLINDAATSWATSDVISLLCMGVIN